MKKSNCKDDIVTLLFGVVGMLRDHFVMIDGVYSQFFVKYNELIDNVVKRSNIFFGIFFLVF